MRLSSKNRVTAGVAAVDLYENKLAQHDKALEVLIALHQARLDFDRADARTARALLRPWPQPSSMTATIAAYEGVTQPSLLDEAETARLRAIAAE